MTTDRVDPFKALQNFKPKTDSTTPPISVDIDKLSSDNNFPSREAPQAELGNKRKRFGASPKVQFNIRVDVADQERFYRIAEERGISKLGDLFGKCLDALEQLEKMESEK
ncbi:stability/partitioning determinant (plasmid) [Pseudomonas sp. R4-76]|uniref:stability/partitioning determinant n=1 Tax=unclassified Pseudomonas TaxID=196821 RepID=UPI003DA8C6FC